MWKGMKSLKVKREMGFGVQSSEVKRFKGSEVKSECYFDVWWCRKALNGCYKFLAAQRAAWTRLGTLIFLKIL